MNVKQNLRSARQFALRSLLCAGLALTAVCIVEPVNAGTLTLNTLSDSVMVGQNDTDFLVEPVAPGDNWFTGDYAGTVRQRTAGSLEELRTQWYIRFDISALNGIDPSWITDVTLSLPQIGRLNSVSAASRLQIFDTNATWGAAGGDYPTWNLGREAPVGSPGGTLLHDFGTDSYQTFGTAINLGDTAPDPEAVFVVNNAALLAMIQSWAANPAQNEGLLIALVGNGNAGLAFGAPTLQITYSIIPEPSAFALAGIGLMMGAVVVRRRRSRSRASG